jgi:hypothetical protein
MIVKSWKSGEAVQKVPSTLAATSGNLKYEKFLELNVVEMAFRPTFWTASFV